MELSYSTYKANGPVRCPHCQWQGNAQQLSSGDYHPQSNILDLDCPACHQHIGFVQFPVDHSKPYDEKEDSAFW